MNFLRPLLYLAILGMAVATAVRMILKNRAVNKGWKEKEEGLRKEIEQRTGQKIREEMFLDATLYGDFQHGGFSLWLAFTADNVALVIKDAVTEKKDINIFVCRKDDVSIAKKRLRVYIMQTEPSLADKGKDEQLEVAIPKSKMEILRHHIRNIKQ